jgi:hypothetical protein
MWSSFVLHVCRSADHGSAGWLAYVAPVASDAAARVAPPGDTVDNRYFPICNKGVAGLAAPTSAADPLAVAIVVATAVAHGRAEIATWRGKRT